MPHQYLAEIAWPALAVPLLALSVFALRELTPQLAGPRWPALWGRKERRARDTANRLREDLLQELSRLEERNERLRAHIEEVRASRAQGPLASLFGPDLLLDLHGQAIASLRERVELAHKDLLSASGRQLQRRCLTLAELPQEVSVLATELAERERTWELKGQPWLDGLRAARALH